MAACLTRILALGGLVLAASGATPVAAQKPGGPPAGPPAVGIVTVMPQQVVQTDEFVGRIQAINRVNIVARVSAFLQEQAYADGAEVKRGDVLFKLERGPFEAEVQQRAAAVAQVQATQANDQLKFNRASALLNTPAGQRSIVDDTRAQLLADGAQLMQAQAQLRASQINLAYTTIVAPIDGKIGRTLITPGNVVSAGSGTLITLVSQDPMYVLFPVSRGTLERLRSHYASHGGVAAVRIKVRLQDGSTYEPTGRLLFVDNTTSTTTDSVLLEGEIANPFLPGTAVRRLIDGQFVTVLLEGNEPVNALGVPRAAVLSDQDGDYVFVVGGDNIARRAGITLGQSTPATAIVVNGLRAGQSVVLDGIQRVHDGQAVLPAASTARN